MKLHLPVKLRASLIAAVIAVSASMYNARAVDYVAPSDTFGWTSNDMTLTERYLATSGNTYTAVSSEYYVFKTYADNPNVRVAYATINGQVTELDYNGAAYSHNGQGVDPEGYYVLGTANGSMDETYIPVTVAGNGTVGSPLEVTAANAGDTPTKKNDPAIITIAATTPTSGSLVSVMGDKSSFTTNGALEIDNSVKSAEGYTGDVTIDTNSIVIKPDSQGAGSTVVLEDVTISDYDEDGDITAISTQIGDNSKLVIVDGNVANVTDEARTQMNLEDISSSEGVEYGQNSVNLGAVSGTGSLTIVGDKDAEGNSSLDVDIASISGTGSAAFGEVNVANADADVAGSVSNATTVSLSNSQTNVGGGVTTRGLNVDGAATLAAQGMVSNLNNQGAGHVNISGTVTSENGSINLTNGKANEGLGVKEGAVLEAGQDILLSNVDAVAPGSLKAEGSLTLTSDASLQNAGKDEEGNDRVSVGNDLLVGGGSSISNSSLTVGGDVQVTDQLTGYTSDAEASTLTDSAITVKPKEGESSTVTIANGSSATDTTIIGADGDIAVTGKVNADKSVTKTTVSGTKGTTNFISSVDEAGNVTERKGALADTLTDLKAGSEEGLTMSPADKKAALEEAGYQVTSMIGNTKGNVSINNADVTGTVVTGGGNVEIGDTTGTANTNADLMAQIRKQLPVLDGIGDIEGKFSTYVDGSIIDVRGNLNADPKLENDLTIGDAAVTNTIILGITGDIKVSHAVLDNDYIDGGKGLDLDDVIIIDTPIVNMEADIKLTNSTITGTTEGGFVLNTLGTADYIDKDAYTGGSILLDGATLQNGVIKSGYRATYTEDGFVWTKQESEKLAQVMGASGLEDLDGVTKLPYGEVSIKNSTLKSMDVETVAGNIELNGNENNVENDLNAAAGASNSVSNGIKSFSTSLITLGGADESTVLKSITVQERAEGSKQQASGPVKLVIRDAQGNQIASSTNSVTMSNQSANRTWTFDSVALDPTQVYTYAFVNENGSEITTGVGLNLIQNGGVSTDRYGSSYGAIVSAVVSPGRDNPDAYTNHILGASIATGNGALNAVRTYMDSLTTTSGEGEEAVTTVTKTTLTATKDSQLNASYAKGTDITIHDDAEGAAPNLSIYNSVLRGDVTMDVDGWVTVDGNSDVALDGYAAGKTDADGNAVKDAGITATVLRLEVLKGDAASITNGEVHIAEATMLRDRPSIDGHVNTLTLSATSGQLGNLFDEMDIHPDAQNQNPYGGATVHIKDGSDISTGIIATGTTKDGQAPTDHGDTSLNKSYFGHIFVEGDSKLTATDTAIIKDYKENVNVGDAYSKFKGADAEGSSVVFEKDAWLTDAHIIGLNNRPTGKYGVKATGPITSTTINGDAHIGTLRLDSEAVLNLVNKGEESVTSYIANIKPGFDDTYYVGAEKGAAHGTINVVNETLVTPDLNKADNRGESYLSLGLNGATVELGSVTAEQGATVASDSAVNPHVHVREITNAVIAGAPAVDKTPGKSTIRTTLNRFLSGSVEATTGEAAQGSVKSFYYVARNTGEDGWTPTDGTYYKYDAAAGTLTEVDTIHDGDIIVKKDSLESKELAKLDGSSETVVTGVVADSGVTLDATEVGYLDRITVPVVDESGNVVYNTVDQNVPLNQPYTEESVTIFPDAAGSIPGVVESKTDGIASLTVDQDFDADNTVINAYQIGVQYADAGTTTADENSGFITIKGDLTGQDNELTADKDIRIGGIVAAPTTFGDFETSAMVVNANEVTSLGGDITIGSNGIVGQQNTVTAQTGSVVVEGSVKGWSNTIDGAVSAEVKGGLLKESQTKVVGENETTLSVSANYNIVTSKGNVSIGADAASGDSIQGSNNNITSTEEGDVIIAGTTRGDSNLISAVLGNVTTNAIVGNQNTIKTDGGKVTTQDITGNTNTITAKVPEGTELAEGDTSTGSVSTGTVTGDSNTITAENEAWVEAIVGDQNSVTAQNDILIDGGILPTLDAAGNVTATSDNNTILSHAGNVELGASETWVTTGDDDRFETAGYPLTSIFGDHNTVTAEAGDIYAEGNVSGNSNSLTAQKTEAEDGTVTGGNILLDQVNANIIGDENSLKADAAITTATIQGNENVLTAGTSIKTGDITDDTATGHITGDLNQLTAGEDITVDGDITGNENTLTAGATLTVAGTVSGADNTLTGAGDVSVGGVEGEGNLISSTGGDVTVNGDVIGSDVDGDGNVDSNALIAHDRVVVEGTVAGENTMIIAYASGLSQDDVAISIGTFAAQGTDLRIATTSDPVYGVTNGNGSILIDTMAAAQQWVDGELVPAEVDADLVNHIISNNSYVLIGQMEGSNAYTQITAAKDVIIGSPVDTLGLPHDDTASHLTITAKNLQINNQSLTLTDSVVNVTGSITGTSLTLTTSTDQQFVSTAANVTLDSLTVRENAHLNATGAITLENLTIDGTLAGISGSTLKVTNTLTLMNGAALAAFNISAPNLAVINSSVNTERLLGLKGLTVTGSTVSVTQGLTGLTNDVIAQSVYIDAEGKAIVDANNNPVMEGELIDGATEKRAYLTAESIGTTGNVLASNASIVSRSTISAKDITATNGGLIEAAGDITATGALAVNGGSTITTSGKLSGTSLTANNGTVKATQGIALNTGKLDASQGSSLTGDVLSAGDVSLTGGSTLTGSVKDMTGSLTVTGVEGGAQSIISGSVAGATSATLKNASTGSLTMGGVVTEEGGETDNTADVTLTDGSTVNGSIANAGDVTVTGDSVVSGKTGMHGDLEVTNATVANVEGAMGATLTDAHAGDLEMGSETVTVDGKETTTYGTVTATGSSLGTVSNAGDVEVTDTTAGDITFADGSLTATGSRLGDVSNATGSDITGSVEVDSLGTGDLTVHKDASLTSMDEGGITANGALSIEGGVTAKEGNISLTGKADKDGNTSKVSSADVTAEQGTLTLAGEMDADHATFSADKGVTLDGTLNAGEAVAFEGKLTGKGTINKTGGDTLELAGTTNLKDGAVNVSDKSTLDVGDGAHLGKLKLTDGATLEVEGEGIGGVSASTLTMDKSAAINTDADLAKGKADRVTVDGAADLKGATVNLRTDETVNEAAVADQSRLTIVEAGSIASSVNEDVAHGLDTLNVHAENTGSTVDLVFSKNYKGVEGKTFNQSQAAAGLASLEHLQPSGELAEVMDALHHTRSGADALAALDSLGGAGLAGVQKVVADDTKEHLQTLRSTIKSTAAGVQYRYDEYGQRIPDKDSNALSGTVTGGHSEVDGSGNCGKYERDSIGFMLAYVHALPNKDWKFGGDLAYSYADASCASTTIKSDVVYLDLALTHDRGRFHQMGTLGVALFSIDTERDASVKAAGHQYAGHADGSTDAVEFNVSYEMNYDLVVKDQHRLSSVVMAEATFAQFDTMKESGMGNAGLTSEWDDMASLTFGLGARYTYSFGEERNPGYFAAEALFVAETGDTMPKVSNSFIGGGAAFDQEGPDAGDCGLRLNAGVLIPLGDQWGVFGNVTSEFRENQTSVGGGVGVKCTF